MQDMLNTLNSLDPNVTYTSENNQITGTYTKTATATGPVSQTSIEQLYKVVVTLHDDRTYTFMEQASNQQTDSGPSAQTTPIVSNPLQGLDNAHYEPGRIKLYSKEISGFQGKTWGMKQSGFVHKWGGDTITYGFDADKIKRPLFEALQAQGYQPQKKSFFKSIFGK